MCLSTTEPQKFGNETQNNPFHTLVTKNWELKKYYVTKWNECLSVNENKMSMFVFTPAVIIIMLGILFDGESVHVDLK